MPTFRCTLLDQPGSERLIDADDETMAANDYVQQFVKKGRGVSYVLVVPADGSAPAECWRAEMLWGRSGLGFLFEFNPIGIEDARAEIAATQGNVTP